MLPLLFCGDIAVDFFIAESTTFCLYSLIIYISQILDEFFFYNSGVTPPPISLKPEKIQTKLLVLSTKHLVLRQNNKNTILLLTNPKNSQLTKITSHH
jgi:hypothetical protein